MLSTVGLPAGEALLLALLLLAVYLVVRSVLRKALPATVAGALTGSLRRLLYYTAGLGMLAIVGANAWIVWQGFTPWQYTWDLVRSIRPETLQFIGLQLGKLALAAVAVVIAGRVAKKLLKAAEDAINRWDQVQDNDQSLASLFSGLHRALVNAAWLAWLVLASWLLTLPPAVTATLLVVLRVYVIVSVGLAVVRVSGVIVDTLDGFSRDIAHRRDWTRYYELIQPLVPTIRAALEYVLWIATAAMALAQVDAARGLAVWGPRLIQAIGIFLAGRIVMELGQFEIGHRMLPRAGLSESERRRRSTMVPLVKSAFTYAGYFTIAVLVLASLGFNPMPFLAGAGILGLVVGFGAQSLINDVVSGFFILFENVYLVGDTIQTREAAGVVEAIEFRTTKIRDEEGRLHIIRNGDIGRVVNFSRDYAMAMVSFDVPYDVDMGAVFDTVREAAAGVCEGHADVLEATRVDGITKFGERGLTVRTATRARPGRHEAVAAEMRLAIKNAFDRRNAEGVRVGLGLPPAGPPRPLPGPGGATPAPNGA